MNSAIANVLNRVLGDFIDNLNPTQLNLSVFKGKINLRNLSLKPKLMDLLALPFTLKHGLIGKIDVDIPWSSLGSTPLVIDIDEIVALVSPKSDKRWSKEEMQQNILASIQESLDNFDALNHPELEISDEPGYFAKMIEKVIDNLQVNIKKIYIRYEDKLTADKPFCIGVKLFEANVVTCNSQWNVEYVSDAKVCNKLLRIKDFSIFIDYDSGVVSSKNSAKGTRGEVVNRLMNEDFAKKLNHKYVLFPVTMEAKLVINKKPEEGKEKVVIGLGQNDEFKMDVQLEQVSQVIRVLNYLKVFDIFKAGVVNDMDLKDMPENLKQEYRNLYLKYRQEYLKSPDSKSTEKAKKDLISKELNLNLQSLKQERNFLLKSLHIEKSIESKQKEIDSLQKEGQGTVSKVFGFFSTKSEKEKSKEQSEKQEKIQKLSSEIKSFHENKKILEEQKQNLNEKQSEAIRIKVLISFSSITLSVLEGPCIVSSKLSNFAFTLDLSSTISILSSLASIEVLPGNASESILPFLLRVQPIDFYFNEKLVKLSSKGADVNTNLPIILSIVNKILLRLNEASDLDKLISKTTSFVSGYISSGQDYMKSVLKQGASASILLDIALKAPVIYVPGKNPQDFLILDLGNLTLMTEHKKGKNCEYDDYALKLKQIKIFKAEKSQSSEDWKNHLEILKPADVQVNFRLYSRLGDVFRPVFKVFVNFFDPYWKISLSELRFILEVVEMISSGSGSSSSLDAGVAETEAQGRQGAGQAPTEIESLSQVIKNFGEIQPWSFDVQFNSFKLELLDELAGHFLIDLESIDFVMLISCRTRVSIKLFIESFAINDQRVLVFKDVLSKANQCKNKHLRFLLDYNPDELFTEISVALGDSEIVVNKNTIENALVFVKDLTALFPPAAPVQKPPAHFTRVFSRFVISVIVQGVSVLLPLNPSLQDSNKTGVSFTSFIVYSSITSLQNFYTSSGEFCRSDTETLQDEASVQLSHFIVSQHSPSTSSKNTILKPSRISASYSGSLTAQEDFKRIDLNTESLLINFSFYDIYSINKILQLLSFPAQAATPPSSASKLSEKPSKFILNLDGDSLQVNLIDDTGKRQKHVLHLQLSNISGFVSVDQGCQVVTCSTLVLCNCFNRKLGAWEPLLEDWKIDFSLEQRSQNDPVLMSLKSENSLEVNVNSSILAQVSQVISCLSFEYSDTCHMADLEKSAKKSVLQYKVINELDRAVVVSLGFVNNQDKWKVESGASYEFTQRLIDSLFVNSNPYFKSTTSVGITQAAACFVIEVEGFDKVSGVGFEEVDVRGFVLQSQETTANCAVVTSSDGLFRTVRIVNALQIANNADIDLQFSYHGSSFSVCKGKSKLIPVLFQRDLDSILVKNVIYESLITGRMLVVQDQCLIVESFEYQILGDGKFLTVEINPAFVVHNLLPGKVSFSSQSKHLGAIAVGEKLQSSEDLAPGQKCFLVCETGQGRLASLEFELNDELKLIQLSDNKGNLAVDIKEQDLRKNSLIDFGLKVRTKQAPGLYSSKIFTLFIETIILNKTANDLVFVDQELNKYSWIIFNGKKGKIKFKESNFCKEFSVDTLALSGILNCKHKNNDQTYNLGVQIGSAVSAISLTKIVKVLPRYTISNNLDRELYIQVFTTDRTETLKSNSTLIFDPLVEKPAICISPDNKNWSGPFKIEDLGDFQIRFIADWNLKSPDWKKGKFGFIRVLISTADEATINISLVYPQEPEYLIKNNTESAVKVSQHNYTGPELLIKPGKSRPWTFDSFVEAEPKVKVLIGSLEGKYSLDKIKKCKKLGEFYLEVTVKDSTRRFEIRTAAKSDGRGSILMPSSLKVMKFEFTLARLGVSISDASNVDMVYASLIDVKGKMKVVEGAAENKLRKNLKYDLKVQNFQIDNMYTDPQLFPVILNKHIYKKDEEDLTPFLQVKVYTESSQFDDGTPPFDKITWFEFCVQPISIKINEETIFALINLKEYFSVFSSEANKDVELDLDPRYSSPLQEYKSVNRKAYFEFFRICGVKLEVTFRMSDDSNKTAQRSSFLPLSFLKSFGKAFTNISSAPLSFTEILITHGFQTLDNMTSSLIKNLIRQAAMQVFKILGSSDLIGNPVGLIDKLGTGVFEFVNEPAKGLLKGPKCFAQGVGKGVRSLVGGIVAGSFESISKISGSLYNVLNDVGGDGQRASRHDDSSGVMQGIKGGVLDVASGITGVFTKPFKGAKEQGAKGFFKGVGTGLFGLVSTPFKIVLKIGSTLTSGIAQGATLLAKGQIQTFGRVRFPRQSNHKQVLEPYNNELAQAKELIRKEGGDQRIVNYSHLNEGDEIIFIITTKMIWVLSGDEVGKIMLKDLKNMEIDLVDEGFVLVIGGKGKRFLVPAESYGALATLYYSIVSIAGPVEAFKAKKEKKSRFCT